jgi:hypothetical protein
MSQNMIELSTKQCTTFLLEKLGSPNTPSIS